MTVTPGQIWRPTNPARAGRIFRVMRTDETHAHVLTLTREDGTPIPSYLQRVTRLKLKHFAPKYGYRRDKEHR